MLRKSSAAGTGRGVMSEVGIEIVKKLLHPRLIGQCRLVLLAALVKCDRNRRDEGEVHSRGDGDRIVPAGPVPYPSE